MRRNTTTDGDTIPAGPASQSTPRTKFWLPPIDEFGDAPLRPVSSEAAAAFAAAGDVIDSVHDHLLRPGCATTAAIADIAVAVYTKADPATLLREAPPTVADVVAVLQKDFSPDPRVER